MIEETDQTNFEQRVIEGSMEAPVLVDFWAPWCAPCRTLAPILERTLEPYRGKIRLVKLNTDENPELASRYHIQGIPAVKAFVGGKVADEFVGVLPERQIREFIERLLPTEADRLARKAKDLEETNPAEAMGLYTEALKHDPNHPAALMARIRLLLRSDSISEARTLFNRLPENAQGHPELPRLKVLLNLALARQSGPSLEELQTRAKAAPEDLNSQWDLAIRLSAEGHYARALEAYLSIVKRDRRFKDDGARKAMIELFEVIGPRSPLAEEFRDRLAQTIF